MSDVESEVTEASTAETADPNLHRPAIPANDGVKELQPVTLFAESGNAVDADWRPNGAGRKGVVVHERIPMTLNPDGTFAGSSNGFTEEKQQEIVQAAMDAATPKAPAKA